MLIFLLMELRSDMLPVSVLMNAVPADLSAVSAVRIITVLFLKDINLSVAVVAAGTKQRMIPDRTAGGIFFFLCLPASFTLVHCDFSHVFRAAFIPFSFILKLMAFFLAGDCSDGNSLIG